jgi:hypothetical protein
VRVCERLVFFLSCAMSCSPIASHRPHHAEPQHMIQSVPKHLVPDLLHVAGRERSASELLGTRKATRRPQPRASLSFSHHHTPNRHDRNKTSKTVPLAKSFSPRILALNKAAEVVLDDEAGRLSADGHANADGAVLGLHLHNHRAQS